MAGERDWLAVSLTGYTDVRIQNGVSLATLALLSTENMQKLRASASIRMYKPRRTRRYYIDDEARWEQKLFHDDAGASGSSLSPFAFKCSNDQHASHICVPENRERAS